ncbi:hypothetical protein [Staphylococcus borealis]|uniref:hypothetical protein n=1 Tax=Staphylococcus borealis TaxID=2742203 RepID=UPI00374FC79D
MNNSKAIKSLFKIQTDEEKLKIINNFDLTIDGFSNINKKKIEKNRDFINNKVNSGQNVFKIEKKIKQELKNDENEFDYILNPEIIVKKYGHDFNKLIKVFYKDGYSELTIKIIDLLNINFTIADNDFDEEKNDNKNTSENEKDNLRRIIVDLQDKIKSRENKINELINYKTSNSKKTKMLEEKLTLKDSKINELKKDVEKLENSQSVKEKEIQLYLEELEKYKVENINLKRKTEEFKIYLKKQVHIIGVPNDLKNFPNKLLNFYSSNESDLFIQKYNDKPNDDYYIFKPNVTTYVYRQIHNNTKVTSIKTKNELISILKKVDENE